MIVLVGLALGCEPVDLGGVMAAVDLAIEGQAPGRGLELLESVWQRLPDACAPLSQADIGAIAWRASGHAWLMDAPDGARMWAERACTMAPDVQVPTSNPVGQRVCGSVQRNPRSVFVAEQNIVVDGVPYATGARTELVTGVHAVHWQDANSWVGRRFTLEEGIGLSLPSGGVAPPDGAPKKRPSIALPVSLVLGGGAIAAGGGVVFQTLFADRWYTDCRLSYDILGGWDRCETEAGVPLSGGFYGGIGMMAAGAAIGVTGLGLGLPVLLSTDGRSVVVSGRF